MKQRDEAVSRFLLKWLGLSLAFHGEAVNEGLLEAVKARTESMEMTDQTYGMVTNMPNGELSHL